MKHTLFWLIIVISVFSVQLQGQPILEEIRIVVPDTNQYNWHTIIVNRDTLYDKANIMYFTGKTIREQTFRIKSLRGGEKLKLNTDYFIEIYGRYTGRPNQEMYRKMYRKMAGDVDGNGYIDLRDLKAFQDNFRQPIYSKGDLYFDPGDMNHDHMVDLKDLSIIQDAFRGN